MARKTNRFPPAALDTAGAAMYCEVSPSYLEACRLKPERGGPPYVRRGRLVRYLREDLDAWLRAGRVLPLPWEKRHNAALGDSAA
jgi:hypothetical protein